MHNQLLRRSQALYPGILIVNSMKEFAQAHPIARAARAGISDGTFLAEQTLRCNERWVSAHTSGG